MADEDGQYWETAATTQEQEEEKAMELPPHEEQNTCSINSSNANKGKKKKKKFIDEDEKGGGGGWRNWGSDHVEYERVDEDEVSSSSSLTTGKRSCTPTIRIRRILEDSIEITSMVDKHVSLTSSLFSILEEEKLDVVFENQFRAETRVSHSIRVRVQPGYDIDGLEKKLRLWAGCSSW